MVYFMIQICYVGFKPVWKERFDFDVHVPELAMVRLVVYDSDRYIDDFIGYYVVPANSLVEGKICNLCTGY